MNCITVQSVGCRVSVQSSQNEILRLLGVDVEATNHGWLCDKGRFGFQYLGAPERVRRAPKRSVIQVCEVLTIPGYRQ